MSLLEQDIMKKRRMNQKNTHTLPEPKQKFEAGDNNKKYKVKLIIHYIIYDKKANHKLSDLYYLVL